MYSNIKWQISTMQNCSFFLCHPDSFIAIQDAYDSVLLIKLVMFLNKLLKEHYLYGVKYIVSSLTPTT